MKFIKSLITLTIYYKNIIYFKYICVILLNYIILVNNEGRY